MIQVRILAGPFYEGSNPSEPVFNKMKTICVFGASTTLGLWDYEKGGWVNRLRLYFDNKDSDITVYNLGVDGDSTNDLLERFEIECEAREPDIIIFSIGDNDSYINSKGEFNVSLEQFERNILELINLSGKFAKKIIFIGLKPIDELKTKPVPWDKNVNYTESAIKKYDEKLKSLIEKEEVMYIDISRLFNKEDLEDGLHPNSKGHEKMFEAVRDFLINNKII